LEVQPSQESFFLRGLQFQLRSTEQKRNALTLKPVANIHFSVYNAHIVPETHHILQRNNSRGLFQAFQR